MSPNPFIYDTGKPSKFVPPRTTPNKLQYEMDCLVAQLRWKHALVDCQVAGLAYTEIHFWRNPETDEFVLTYWEIPQ